MLSTIVIASLSGTTQLITLCLTGAYLAHRHIITTEMTRSLSSSIYHTFLPALLFTSTLNLPLSKQTNSTNLILPPLWALLTMSISALTAAPISLLTSPPIRRTVFIALLLGNANNLPLLLLHTLCDDLALNHGCYQRADSYVALYLTFWNTLMWTAALQFLYNTPDDTIPSDIITVRAIQSAPSSSSQNHPSLSSQRLSKVFSPPFVSIIAGAAIALITPIQVFFHHYLAPILHALTLLSQIVVPMSSIIIGARLYIYHQQQPKNTPLTPFSIFSIVVTRFVILPLVGRFIYSYFKISNLVTDPILCIYLLIPFFMPTASNSVVMVQMAASYLPNVGQQMENALLLIIFWQYLFAPLFLTINMAVGLAIIKESGGLS